MFLKFDFFIVSNRIQTLFNSSFGTIDETQKSSVTTGQSILWIYENELKRNWNFPRQLKFTDMTGTFLYLRSGNTISSDNMVI